MTGGNGGDRCAVVVERMFRRVHEGSQTARGPFIVEW